MGRLQLQSEAPSRKNGAAAAKPAFGGANWSDYIWIGATQVLIIVAGLLVYRLAGRWFGPDGFAEYALARRTLTMVLPLLVLGVNLALSRQVAMDASQLDRGRDFGYFLAAFGVASLAGVVFAIAVTIAPQAMAFLFFGERRYSYLMPAILVLAVGSALHLMCYGYFRGAMRFKCASIVEILNIAAAPLAAFVLFPRSAAHVLFWTGVFICATCLIALIAVGGRKFTAALRAGFKFKSRTLLSYGLQRVPGDFAWAALFGLPPVFAAHWVGLREAGLVAFGNTMLTLAGAAVAPVNVVLLPQSVRMLQSGEHAELKAHVYRVLGLSVGLAILGTCAGELCMGAAVRLYLGPEYEAAAGIVRILILAIPPCVVYVCLRSVVDAAYHRALNSINLCIALGVLVALTVAGNVCYGGILPILIAFVASVYLLGVLTWLQIRKTLEHRAIGCM